jgi:hypothetical protein
VGRSISPNDWSSDADPDATAKRAFESFFTEIAARQPSSSTASESTRNTSRAPGSP